MEILIAVVFILGYIGIALEHNFRVDKAAFSLIAGMSCWALYVFTLQGDAHDVQHIIEHGHGGNGGLIHHVWEIASILFFLIGAMTIVELVDAHEGFSIITDKIKTTKKVTLLWIICLISFFFSAALDNLTTAIVMISLLRKLIDDKETRWFFAGMVIIAANAGGAWSPIGDVTTTMLWIKGQLPDTLQIVSSLLLPSLATILVPLIILSFRLKGNVARPIKAEGVEHYTNPTTTFERNFVFSLGVLGLLFVPIFKLTTDLPPYMGMMFSLGCIWAITEILHRNKNYKEKKILTVVGAVKKIDVPTIFFFLGILLAVHGLQTIGTLGNLADLLRETFNGDIFIINLIIGLLSAIVDNVPLVAGAIQMYDGTAIDSSFWEFLAYCAGTGGSVLIIGSAAGVAIMGILKIDFFWYLRKIAFLAFIGYVSGAFCYWVLNKDKTDTKLEDVQIENKTAHTQIIDFDVMYNK